VETVTVAIDTLGCKVNQQESEALAIELAALGFSVVAPSARADAYVVNSCTVTQTADGKTRQRIRRARAKNPDALICLIGCAPQADPDAWAAVPDVDLTIPSDEKHRTAALLAQKLRPAKTARPQPESGNIRARTRAFLKIEDGCDRGCAYCIVPKARGAVRSKPPEAVLAEAAALLADGYREIVVTGINIALYGTDLGQTDGLYDLLSRVTDMTGPADSPEYRVRLGSLEPAVVDAAAAARIARLPRLCPQMHLSLQSGCARTLRAMGRPYTPSDYTAILNALRDIDPLFAVTTDVIAGFPGETDADFEESLAFVENAGFARVHVFPYSRRPGTPAANMADKVPEREKAARARRLLDAAERAQQRFFEANVGQTRRTLLLGGGRALTDNGIDLRIPSELRNIFMDHRIGRGESL
jgi:threonylcarbamoyladenosine tRNA methylthiotransferase MtaB